MKELLTTLAVGVNVNKVGNNTDSDLSTSIVPIINAVIGILGLVCVVVMIIGGVNCVLAFALVNWVIGSILSQ